VPSPPRDGPAVPPIQFQRRPENPLFLSYKDNYFFPIRSRMVSDSVISEGDALQFSRQKLEAVGQLAAGIAHEINTPMQYIGDSVYFLRYAFERLLRLNQVYREACHAVEGIPGTESILEQVRSTETEDDPDYLSERVPGALERTVDGIEHVASIVRAIKDFAHPGSAEKIPVDLHAVLENALLVARNQYKYVARVETDFGTIPELSCHAGELNQVFLNLIVNAAHAVGCAVEGTNELGLIGIRTFTEGGFAVVEIEDTGTGIEDNIRERVFEPFFTSKPMGQGSGQGLTIARMIVVQRQGGTLTFTSEAGRGTTFTVRLPLETVSEKPAGTEERWP